MTTRIDRTLRSCRYDAGITIENSPVREIDWARHRTLWRRLFGLLILMTAGIAGAWQHGELRRYGYDLERLRQERAELEETNRQLWLEVEMLRSPSRIDRPSPDLLALLPAGGTGSGHAILSAPALPTSSESGTRH